MTQPRTPLRMDLAHLSLVQRDIVLRLARCRVCSVLTLWHPDAAQAVQTLLAGPMPLLVATKHGTELRLSPAGMQIAALLQVAVPS